MLKQQNKIFEKFIQTSNNQPSNLVNNQLKDKFMLFPESNIKPEFGIQNKYNGIQFNHMQN